MEEVNNSAYQIGGEIKNRTQECSYGFECLDNENWNTCSIDSSLKGILIIKNTCNKNNCAYSILLGHSYYFCKCPARHEIYHRYKK
jgi:hypothetical protein